MTEQELRIRCDKLRDHLIARKWATADELDEYTPGDPPEWTLDVEPAAYLEAEPAGEHAARARQRLEHDQNAWTLAYAQLSRVWGERNALMRPGTPVGQEQLLKALRDEPEEVQLVSGDRVQVYPKSFDALHFFDEHGWLLDWLTVRADAVKAAAEDGELDAERFPEPASLLLAAGKARSDEVALMCWVATSPGPAFPWLRPDGTKVGPDGEVLEGGNPWEPSLPVPRTFYDLHPLDVRFIRNAYLRVNFLRLNYLPKLTRKDGEERGFDSFFATRAKKTGRTTRHLMLHESFASQLAEETLAAASLEDVFG